jgi:prevent-host-death family protein
MTQTVSMAEAKSKLSEIVGQVKYGGKEYILERRGQPMAVLISIETYEQLQEQAAETAVPASLPPELRQRQRILVEKARQLEALHGDPVARLAEFWAGLPPDDDDFWLEIQETG